MDWIKLTERREAGHRQIIMGSEYIKNQASNTPGTRKVGGGVGMLANNEVS